MNSVENLAVFDLDGTLWKENSHYEILNSYFKTNFYKSFLFRLYRHFFKESAYELICKKYEKIPKDYASSFLIDFNDEILMFLRQKQREGYCCIIVSNAPLEILSSAANALNVPYLKAPIGKKKEVLDQNYAYKNLFVCTDNVEDIDLVEASNSRKIIYTNANKIFFASRGF